MQKAEKYLLYSRLEDVIRYDVCTRTESVKVVSQETIVSG